MASREKSLNNEQIKISPASSSNSEHDGSNDAQKINNEKMIGDSDDENLSGFDSDSEDETHQQSNYTKPNILITLLKSQF